MIGSSGIGTYLEGLVSEWNRTKPPESMVLFGNKESTSGFAFKTVSYSSPIYSLSEQWRGPRVFSKESIDLLHVPHYNIPVFYAGPMVVTIHDIIHLLYPNMARRKGALYYARWMLKTAVKKAKRIVVVSEKTKNDVLEHLGADPAKLRVIHPAIPAGFSRVPPAAFKTTLARHGLEPGFILFVGDVRPHKNVEGLLAAHKLLRRLRADCPPVVVVGKTERVPAPLLEEKTGVRWLGALPKQELIHLYSSAGVLAFPTLYEGFGLPPLEAMACGCPVVASRTGGLPESVGDAGLTVDPHDPSSIAEGITKTLWETPLRERLIEKGLARSKNFSWEKAARETWKVYEEALGQT